MNKRAAIKLAVDAIERQIKIIAVDANMFDRGIADHPYAKQCSEKRKKLLEAIEVLNIPELPL